MQWPYFCTLFLECTAHAYLPPSQFCLLLPPPQKDWVHPVVKKKKNTRSPDREEVSLKVESPFSESLFFSLEKALSFAVIQRQMPPLIFFLQRNFWELTCGGVGRDSRERHRSRKKGRASLDGMANSRPTFKSKPPMKKYIGSFSACLVVFLAKKVMVCYMGFFLAATSSLAFP